MTTGLSDAIREYARVRYVVPAVTAGNLDFAIRVKDVWNDLKTQGFEMSGRTPQICSALRTEKFLEENGLAISRIDGPPSGQSPTVVFHYKVTDTKAVGILPVQLQDPGTKRPAETPEEWAHRMTGKLYGLLREEIAGIGGTEAFIRWVRSEDEERAGEHAA